MTWLAELQTTQFWAGLGVIVWVNIILSGDNAVVIALAARSLPPNQQRQAILGGAGAAVILRIALTLLAVKLLSLPYLKIIGGLLLFWIAVQLLAPEAEGDAEIKGSDNLFQAIRIILIADLVMSLDNVVAVAAAAKGSNLLLILGLAISIPLVIFSAAVLMRLMERFPSIVLIGAGLIGAVAGEMLISDPTVEGWIHTHIPWMDCHVPLLGEISWAQIVGASLVLAVGRWMARRASRKAAEEALVDLSVKE